MLVGSRIALGQPTTQPSQASSFCRTAAHIADRCNMQMSPSGVVHCSCSKAADAYLVSVCKIGRRHGIDGHESSCHGSIERPSDKLSHLHVAQWRSTADVPQAGLKKAACRMLEMNVVCLHSGTLNAAQSSMLVLHSDVTVIRQQQTTASTTDRCESMSIKGDRSCNLNCKRPGSRGVSWEEIQQPLSALLTQLSLPQTGTETVSSLP